MTAIKTPFAALLATIAAFALWLPTISPALHPDAASVELRSLA